MHQEFSPPHILLAIQSRFHKAQCSDEIHLLPIHLMLHYVAPNGPIWCVVLLHLILDNIFELLVFPLNKTLRLEMAYNHSNVREVVMNCFDASTNKQKMCLE